MATSILKISCFAGILPTDHLVQPRMKDRARFLELVSFNQRLQQPRALFTLRGGGHSEWKRSTEGRTPLPSKSCGRSETNTTCIASRRASRWNAKVVAAAWRSDTRPQERMRAPLARAVNVMKRNHCVRAKDLSDHMFRGLSICLAAACVSFPGGTVGSVLSATFSPRPKLTESLRRGPSLIKIGAPVGVSGVGATGCGWTRSCSESAIHRDLCASAGASWTILAIVLVDQQSLQLRRI
jgi:hypothetical protein